MTMFAVKERHESDCNVTSRRHFEVSLLLLYLFLFGQFYQRIHATSIISTSSNIRNKILPFHIFSCSHIYVFCALENIFRSVNSRVTNTKVLSVRKTKLKFKKYESFHDCEKYLPAKLSFQLDVTFLMSVLWSHLVDLRRVCTNNLGIEQIRVLSS